VRIGPGLADTIDPNEIAYGLISPYLDMSDLTAATEELEPGLSSRLFAKDQPPEPVRIKPLPADTRAELVRFWTEHPDLREACLDKYGYDPVENEDSYWAYGIAEPDHATVLDSVIRNGGTFTLDLALRWEQEELASAMVEKGDKPYGNVTYADPGYQSDKKARYPIDTEEHVRAAWSYINKPGNAGKYSSGDLAKVKARIRAAMKRVGADVEKADVRAAGIAVRSADTGRVLMIQRSLDPKDRARGTWEFPGGCLEDGEHPYVAAKREWQEETGLRLPRGKHVGQWRSGVYHGFVHEVASEAAVKLNLAPEQRRVLNPDDPDSDNIEVIAWHDPEDLRYMRALRPELRASKVWTKVEKGDARPATVRLRVHGVSRTPAGQRVYRMVTRDGQYIGRTNPTSIRARKGDVLKVAANDLLADDHGDLRWMNANVAAQIQDTPHSWRDLCAMAGADVEKDTAPGPAGDIPPAGDTGVDQVWPSSETMRTMEPAAAAGTGPTSQQVHVNRPLKNVSQAYVGRRGKGKPVLRGEFLPISKEGQMKQLVYGVVLAPNELDSQDDFMLPHHVEQAAHGYLKKSIRGKASVAKLQHREPGFFRDKPSIVPVESFIAPVDFTYDGIETIKKGSWVICMHVEDPYLWQDFLDGKYQAFSIGGSGVRHAVSSLEGAHEPDLTGPSLEQLVAALSP
jgi:8-oxo-dGTP pyrophosphatase MutT (NUDIX family)